MESIEPVVLEAQSSASFSGQLLTVPDLDAYRCGIGHLFILVLGQRVAARGRRVLMEILMGTGPCETCAERGRPNEPLYKMGMCIFCYRGLPHPKATPEELARERIGAYVWRLGLLHRGESAAPDVGAVQGNQKR